MIDFEVHNHWSRKTISREFSNLTLKWKLSYFVAHLLLIYFKWLPWACPQKQNTSSFVPCSNLSFFDSSWFYHNCYFWTCGSSDGYGTEELDAFKRQTVLVSFGIVMGFVDSRENLNYCQPYPLILGDFVMFLAWKLPILKVISGSSCPRISVQAL